MKNYIYILVIVLFSCKTHIIEPERTYIPDNKHGERLKKPPVYSKTNLYFIRHAEEDGNAVPNPHLSASGKKRVKLLERYFSHKKLDTIFTTNLNRTFETAKGIATFQGVPIVYYDPFKMSFKAFFKKHKKSNSLIIGHSNTTPNFVNGIIGYPKYSQMMEDNYSDIYRISVDGNNYVYDELTTIEKEIQKMEDAKLSPKELKKVLKERKRKQKEKE